MSRKIEELTERLEEAWGELERLHLALPADLFWQDQETAGRVYAVEQALRAYYDVLRAIERERSREKREMSVSDDTGHVVSQ